MIVEKLKDRGLSFNGKALMSTKTLRMLNENFLKKLLYAIDRTKNLSNIAQVKAKDIEGKIDILTYSFPCQDLSICGFWRGNTTGIDRNHANKSNMLWEVERILHEMNMEGKPLPRVLIMENVSSIESKHHSKNFGIWKEYLESIGYLNKVFHLNALNFGVPQNRKRAFMISVNVGGNRYLKKEVKKYFKKNDLSNDRKEKIKLETFLRTDYTNEIYLLEAMQSNPNDTPSRRRIREQNQTIHDGNHVTVDNINTITTKQDRHPNSGLISFTSGATGKSDYRNLTPRECFLLMGFEEFDFNVLIENNPNIKSNTQLFSREKLIRLAGNSIVVNVLESVFAYSINLLEILTDEKIKF
jgi:DNA (cytosine-5)-methyltransferase 1